MHIARSQVLNPNRHMKSMITTFKMETITEILAIAPRLPPDQASELVQRGHLAVGSLKANQDNHQYACMGFSHFCHLGFIGFLVTPFINDPKRSGV